MRQCERGLSKQSSLHNCSKSTSALRPYTVTGEGWLPTDGHLDEYLNQAILLGSSNKRGYSHSSWVHEIESLARQSGWAFQELYIKQRKLILEVGNICMINWIELSSCMTVWNSSSVMYGPTCYTRHKGWLWLIACKCQLIAAEGKLPKHLKFFFSVLASASMDWCRQFCSFKLKDVCKH